jgi:hypothetical protein
MTNTTTILADIAKGIVIAVAGLALGAIAGIALVQDNNELAVGKSPHSGATPDYPTPAPYTTSAPDLR